MINIILAGNLGDKKLLKTLNKVLPFYHSLASDSSSGFSFPDSPDILILNCSHITNLSAPNTIIVFKESFSSKNKLGNISGCYAITPSENNFALSVLSGKGLSSVTCGLSEKDTVTFSSFTDNSAVVSLQREIINLFGSSVLPCDITFKFSSPPDRFSLLASCATLLLTTKFPPSSISI